MPAHPFLRTSLLFAAANLLAACGFATLLFLAPLSSDVEARSRFRQLDDAGVINAPALAAFDPSYHFGNGTDLLYRSTIPAYLTAPARDQAATSSTFALLLTVANTLLFSITCWILRPKKLPANTST